MLWQRTLSRSSFVCATRVLLRRESPKTRLIDENVDSTLLRAWSVQRGDPVQSQQKSLLRYIATKDISSMYRNRSLVCGTVTIGWAATPGQVGAEDGASTLTSWGGSAAGVVAAGAPSEAAACSSRET